MIKGFELVKGSTISESLLSYREKGALRGVYLGFPILHEHYTMSLPGCTDWTGFPASGKSEFLLELLLNTSIFYGWKHLLYVPDVGDKDEIIAILIHKITGKTFDKRYQSNYISEQEVMKELEWVLHHFNILYKSDPKAKITPYQFWDYAVELKNDTIGGIQTATIDSWKDMKHGVGLDGEVFARDDKYLEDVLSYRNMISERNKMHFNIVIHPIKTEADKDGKRRAPTPYDLKGGSEWYNNGKCMVTIHRIDGSFNGVKVIVTKAKPNSVAKVGSIDMYFDSKIRKFYWEDNGAKIYASKDYVKPIGIQMGQTEIDENDVPF